MLYYSQNGNPFFHIELYNNAIWVILSTKSPKTRSLCCSSGALLGFK